MGPASRWRGLSAVIRNRVHADDDVLNLGVAFDEGPDIGADGDDPETPSSRIAEGKPYEPLGDPATLERCKRLRVDEGDAVAPDDVVDEASKLAVLTSLVAVRPFVIEDRECHAPMVTVGWHGDRLS